jgi:thiol-disulfide isomerase/thioredoxin
MSGFRGTVFIVLLALAGALGGLLLGRWWFDPDRDPPPAPPGETTLALGERRPPLQLPDLDGVPRSLDDYDGAPLLINYWATWCPPCIKELPLLADLHARRDDGGVTVLTIALEYEAEAVRAFLAELQIDLPAWIETPARGDSSLRFGNTRNVLPYSVLIGADGRLLARRSGELKPEHIENWMTQLHQR